MEHAIVFENIKKSFGKTVIIPAFSLHIKKGSFTTLLGPSGCGKTTVLRMLAGLETPDAGRIQLDGRYVFDAEAGLCIPVEKRALGFVFQDFALWPHMTVFENVAFGLHARGKTKHLKERVRQALRMVQLEELADRSPCALSGGQKQRVAFARAIVTEPSIILFDEPLSALDALLREEMRHEIRRITRELNMTAVFVTHDQLEAMSMSDHIAVLQHGRIEQYDTPERIYKQPQSAFVAHFIGKSNWLDKHHLCRPEALRTEPAENSRRYHMQVKNRQFLGSAYELCLDGNGLTWSFLSPICHEIGEELDVYVKEQDIVELNAI